MTAQQKIEALVEQMRTAPAGVKFRDLTRVCDHYFGTPRQSATSHRVYRTPWAGDPRVNIQDGGGMAKSYQVRQVLKAIDRMTSEKDE